MRLCPHSQHQVHNAQQWYATQHSGYDHNHATIASHLDKLQQTAKQNIGMEDNQI